MKQDDAKHLAEPAAFIQKTAAHILTHLLHTRRQETAA